MSTDGKKNIHVARSLRLQWAAEANSRGDAALAEGHLNVVVRIDRRLAAVDAGCQDLLQVARGGDDPGAYAAVVNALVPLHEAKDAGNLDEAETLLRGLQKEWLPAPVSEGVPANPCPACGGEMNKVSGWQRAPVVGGDMRNAARIVERSEGEQVCYDCRHRREVGSWYGKAGAEVTIPFCNECGGLLGDSLKQIWPLPNRSQSTLINARDTVEAGLGLPVCRRCAAFFRDDPDVWVHETGTHHIFYFEQDQSDPDIAARIIALGQHVSVPLGNGHTASNNGNGHGQAARAAQEALIESTLAHAANGMLVAAGGPVQDPENLVGRYYDGVRHDRQAARNNKGKGGGKPRGKDGGRRNGGNGHGGVDK